MEKAKKNKVIKITIISVITIVALLVLSIFLIVYFVINGRSFAYLGYSTKMVESSYSIDKDRYNEINESFQSHPFTENSKIQISKNDTNEEMCFYVENKQVYVTFYDLKTDVYNFKFNSYEKRAIHFGFDLKENEEYVSNTFKIYSEDYSKGLYSSIDNPYTFSFSCI